VCDTLYVKGLIKILLKNKKSENSTQC